MVIIIILISLAIMFYQDIKFREIHILLPVILFFTSIYMICVTVGQKELLTSMLFNFIFLGMTLFLMVIYMTIKNRKFLNPFQNYFGLGDLLFYVAVTPLLLLRNYILFFVLSMVFSIVLYFIFNKQKSDIPLAGYASLLLIIIIAKDMLFNFPSITLIKL